jgi:hypothetical protein
VTPVGNTGAGLFVLNCGTQINLTIAQPKETGTNIRQEVKTPPDSNNRPVRESFFGKPPSRKEDEPPSEWRLASKTPANPAHPGNSSAEHQHGATAVGSTGTATIGK